MQSNFWAGSKNLENSLGPVKGQGRGVLLLTRRKMENVLSKFEVRNRGG